MSTVAEGPTETIDELPPGGIVLEQASPASGRQWFYGWLMLPLATLLMIATSPGQTFGIAYFNACFLDEFGLSKTSLSTVYLLATLLASLGITYVGSLIDRFGLRRSVLFALVAMVAACVFASRISGLVSMFFAFFALRMAGPGSLTLMANNTVAAWFDQRLGKASSYVHVAMAGAWATVPLVFVMLIDAFGWRGAYLVIAGAIACGLLPLVSILYRQSPAELGQLPDGAPIDETERKTPFSWGNELTVPQAMQHRCYWILLAATAMWALVGTGMIFHLAAVFEAVGLDARDSTHAISSLAIVMGATQLLGGIMADRMAVRWLLAASMTLLTATCVVLADADTLPRLVAGYVVFGCSSGLMSIVAGTAWARYFGRTHLGKIRGTSLTAAVGASAIGPVVMGVSADYLDGFEPSFWIFAVMVFGVAVAAFWATPPQVVKRPTAG
jgi:OFA family oxalate/formate antiporter-like MFS transporter